MTDEPDGGFWPEHHPIRRIERKLDQVLAELQELKQMSQNNQSALDAANAALQAGLDKIQTDVTAIAAELQANLPAAGSVPSAASVAALQAQVTRLQTVGAALDALVVPPAA